MDKKYSKELNLPYGRLPQSLGIFEPKGYMEMMFTQYMPIKLSGEMLYSYDPKFNCFSDIISASCEDYRKSVGIYKYTNTYIYLTAKYLFQSESNKFNREGYHSDGFLTEDINYIWSDRFPTVFNKSEYDIILDDRLSLTEMEAQSLPENEVTFPNNSLLRLDQFNIHRVGDNYKSDMRAFVKVSFSNDPYDLKGNSHNYLLNYDWGMKERDIDRNVPQSIII